MNAKPYVGVTGPVTNGEAEGICREFAEAGYNMNSQHIPMLGFLASYKTLNGQATQNRRYPPARRLPELLSQSGNKVLNMIHYNSREKDLAEQVYQLFNGVYPHLCRAIQLNIVWPDINHVKKVKDRFPEMQIVFQASHSAMAGKSPADIARGIKGYGDSLSYVLIDPSGGRGLEFDLGASVNLYSELREQCPGLTIGFAGGFNEWNVSERLKEIISKTGGTDFCIDAEGGLRDKISDDYGDDLLNIGKVRGYLQASSNVLK
ncbi:hypothetical protein HYT92_00280 [Candidatus Pacearchaeota archaeon]|nr:hypothetical protein [Candidatus Pacearchaeota archaeon]